jgi:hypothetical protein
MANEEEDGQLRTGDNKGNREESGKPVSYSPFPLLPSVLIISLGAIP